MDFNISDFKAKNFLMTDNLNVDSNEFMSLGSADFQSVHNITLLPEQVENIDGTDKMLSKQNMNLNETASRDLKSPNTKTKQNLASILNFDSTSLSSIFSIKKNESFIKKLPLKRFECYQCNKNFPSFGEVVMHLKLIHNACASRDCSKITDFKLHSPACANRGFGCAICNKKFDEKHLLLIHFNEHIDAAFYACEVCREGFQQKKDLQKHFFQIHKKFLSLPVTPAYPKTLYQKCSNCSKYFQLFAEFQEHVSLCNSSTYACSICNVSFDSLIALDEHKLSEHKTEQVLKGYMALKHGKRYFCGICYLGFFKGDILKKHVMTHAADSSYICDVCHVNFSCDNDLQEHYLQHIEEHYVLYDVISQHLCNNCMKTFRTQKELKDHKMLKNCKIKKGSTQPCKTLAKTSNLLDKVLQESVTDATFDFSNIPVYVLKVGEDLLNCDDLQCIIVMDLTSLFVLQRGMCASESRMPDVRNSEVYSESEVVDASLLEQHMLQILTSQNMHGSADVDKMSNFHISVESSGLEQNVDAGNTETVVLNINEPNLDAIKCEDDVMHYESVSDAKFEENANSENINGKYEFVVYDTSSITASTEGSSNKVIVRENTMSYINEIVGGKANLNKELLIENDDSSAISGLYICNICKQVFSTKYSLCLHFKGSHTGYDCYRCGDSFASDEELKNHEKVVHLSSFQCDVCDIAYPKEHLLKKHKRTAHSDSFFVCAICNKSYVLRHEYEVHMMLHKGETPPTKCDECGQIYASVSNYMKHKATHEGKVIPKKYICTICDKIFTSHDQLKTHLSSHIRKSPYNSQCPKCKMYFPPKMLAEHVESHSIIL